MSLQVASGLYGELVLGGDLIGGIALKIAGRKNPCDYALIAVGLAEVMEEEEDARPRRWGRDHS